MEYMSTIYNACRDGNIAVVKRLLFLLADPSANGNWAIQLASKHGHLEIVKLLLDDPRVDPSTSDNLAIRCASHNGHTEVVKLLLEDPRVDPSVYYNQAIRNSRENGHTEVVDLLTEHMYRLDGPEYNKNIL